MYSNYHEYVEFNNNVDTFCNNIFSGVSLTKAIGKEVTSPHPPKAIMSQKLLSFSLSST